LLAILAMGSVNASDESANLSAACDVGDESLKDSIAQDDDNVLGSGIESGEEGMMEQTKGEAIGADEATFKALQQKISDAEEGSTITLKNGYSYNDGFDVNGIVISKALTIDGNGFTIDAKNKAKAFRISDASDVTIKNLRIVNGMMSGHRETGYMDLSPSYVMSSGAAIDIDNSMVTVIGCTFANNLIEGEGGAICAQNSVVKVINSNFNGNQAVNDSYGGGAIYVEKCTLNVENSNFDDNCAIGDEDSRGGAISVNEKSTVSIRGCNFNNNLAVGEGGAICTFNFHDEKITMTITDSSFNNNLAIGRGGGIYICKTILNMTGSSFTNNAVYAIHAQQESNAVVRSTTFKDNEVHVYESTVDTAGCKFLYSTELSTNKVSATYNSDVDLVITLKDSFDRAVKGVRLSTNIKGFESLTTDSNGQARIPIGKLDPKEYTVKITFSGDSKYLESSKTVKFTVMKATPKLTAKAKAFKKSVKTKKYSVVLKTNHNKAMKNVKVTLKINRKTFTAKTNGNGKATFKIKKLTKKGTFTSTVTYKGDKYYNKVSKKVKIKVK